MQDKIKTVIEKISLGGPVLSGQEFEPTLVNFFFGKNGTGKTTISSQLGDANFSQFRGAEGPDNYEILRYDETFIDQNVRSYDDMRGVFTITKGDAEDKEKLDSLNDEIKKAKKRSDKLQGEWENIQDEIKDALAEAIEAVWTSTADIRRTFPDTQTGFKKDKEKFYRKILNTDQVDHDTNKISRIYERAYKGGGIRYSLYQIPKFSGLPYTPLLEKQIINSGSTPYADFVKTLKNLSWVEEGHKHYQKISDGYCPYCHQPLPYNFEEELASCYDSEYQKDIDELKGFFSYYKKTLDNISQILHANLAIGFEDTLVDQYKYYLQLFDQDEKTNIQKIRDKINNPIQIVELENIESTLNNLLNIVDKINELIKKNNDAVGNVKDAQAACNQMVWEKMAFNCQSCLSEFAGKKQVLTDNAKKKEEEINKLQLQIETCSSEIAVLNTKTTNTMLVMQQINQMLKDNGFQGFYLQEKKDAKFVYQLVRPDGKIAKGLSEGERHVISFLYFYHLVKGSQSDDGARKDKIVIIDDPVTSMDSGSMALVSRLVRELISICYNNYKLSEETEREDFIRQIFCLTHNPYFFKEITYNRVADYECVSFYELRKGAENRSEVILCTQQKAEPGNDYENYSPVKNYYDGLWQEFKGSDDSLTLACAMRGILEYYFFQICGYHGASEIRERLQDYQAKNGINNEDFNMADTFLSTMDSAHSMLDDGVNIDTLMEPLQARRVFRMIFEIMDQEQHYQLMMGEG